MVITLRLTDYQHAVVQRLRSRTGSPTVAQLAARAVDHDRRRSPEPRWRDPRPPGRTPSPSGDDSRLTAALPPASAATLALGAGHRLRIEQIGDGQGVDLFATTPDGRSFSAARTRAKHGIHPTTGSALWSTPPEAALLTIVADTAPGHDLCFPPCTELEYAEQAGIRGHLGCAELRDDALAASPWRGSLAAASDDVLNLWLPSAVDEQGEVIAWPAACRRGDHVELVAWTDVVVTLTTCPDDVFGTSQYEPKPVMVIVTAGPSGALSTEGWPAAPPASAAAHHRLPVSLSARDIEHVDTVATGGWLGDGRAEVLRALMLRLQDSLV